MPLKGIIFFSTPFKNTFSEKAGLFFNKKIKGGALYIAVIVSIVIGIILSLFIVIARYNQRHVTIYTQSTQLYYNLQSAFQLARSDYFTEEKNNAWIKNLANDDSIKIKKQSWGAYLLISAVTKNRHRFLSQSGLYGTTMCADTGLMVSDNSRPVGLSGAVIFKANSYLPKAGIKPAYIEGQSYISAAQNATFIKQSPGQVPALSDALLPGLEQQRNTNVYADSVVTNLPQNFSQSFSNKTVTWNTGATKLNGLTLKNNLKIICGDIEIDSSCHFQNVLIICKKIRFNEGFKGRVHVIASDSIVAGKKCMFDYPSSFVLLPEDNGTKELKYIQFSEGCRFYGGVLAINGQSNGGDQKVFIKLNAGSEINGFLYSSDYMHVQGKVNATAICNKLLLKTPSAVYENHLLGCEIDPGRYAHVLAVPLVFRHRSKLVCCKNLD